MEVFLFAAFAAFIILGIGKGLMESDPEAEPTRAQLLADIKYAAADIRYAQERLARLEDIELLARMRGMPDERLLSLARHIKKQGML